MAYVHGMLAELVADEKISKGDQLQFNEVGRVIRLKRKGDTYAGNTSYLGVALTDADKDGYVTVRVFGEYATNVIKGAENIAKKVIVEVKHEELKSEV